MFSPNQFTTELKMQKIIPVHPYFAKPFAVRGSFISATELRFINPEPLAA